MGEENNEKAEHHMMRTDIEPGCGSLYFAIYICESLPCSLTLPLLPIRTPPMATWAWSHELSCRHPGGAALAKNALRPQRTQARE